MNRCTACSYHICRVGEGGDYTMKRRLSWEIQMSNSAHWEVCWCVNLVSLKQIYDTFPFFLNLPYAYCYSDGCSYYTLPDFHIFGVSMWTSIPYEPNAQALDCSVWGRFFYSWMFMMSKTEAIPLYGYLR